MKLPAMKAPAGLYLKPASGPAPSAGGYEGAFMFGAFGDCAFLLVHLTPAEGDEYWIESTTGKLSADAIREAHARGEIQRVN